MQDVVFHVRECVEFPRRADKPHRRLPIELAVSAESPGFVDVRCVDETGNPVIEAAIPISTVIAVARVARVFLDETASG